jgi:hypothetical protein
LVGRYERMFFFCKSVDYCSVCVRNFGLDSDLVVGKGFDFILLWDNLVLVEGERISVNSELL